MSIADPVLLTGVEKFIKECRTDWLQFAERVFGVTLDKEQQEILLSVQNNKLTSVASGTARGKDFVAAVAALCFLYLTPKFNSITGELEDNTKVILTGPTDRQVKDIMVPEFTRLYDKMIKNGFRFLAGRKVGYDIRTDYKEWFLTGFKADDKNLESWTGYHAVNIMYVVTEATGVVDEIYTAIEGNLQNNSRLLLVFNPNKSTGYAANSQKQKRFTRFKLSSLTAPNVVSKAMTIPGQVNYEWVKERLEIWAEPIAKKDFKIEENDFEFEKVLYRPNDFFRVKVLGEFPKTDAAVLVPQAWIEAAIQRWKDNRDYVPTKPLRLGQDVAGMGRDCSSSCFRFGDYVEKFHKVQSGGVPNHMEVVGYVVNQVKSHTNVLQGLYPQVFIDAVGEGAGSYSRLLEIATNPEDYRPMQDINFVPEQIFPVKGGAAARDPLGNYYKDIYDQFIFRNVRSYLYWKIREWLDPKLNSKAMLPPGEYRGLSELLYHLRSDGMIELELKDDLRSRIGYSPDDEDALSVTFYPVEDQEPMQTHNQVGLEGYFF